MRKLTHKTAYTPIHIGVADSQTTLIVDVVFLEFPQVSCYESFPTQHSKVLLSVAKFVLICQLFKMCTNFIQFLDHNCNVSPRILIAASKAAQLWPRGDPNWSDTREAALRAAAS